jgi:hypothetical protein
VCKHHNARPRDVLFVRQSDCLCDGGEVLCAGEAVLVRPRLGFGLIAKDDITVWKDLLDFVIEEFEKEWSREVESENLLFERGSSELVK